jgi:hypothetical protein
VGETVFYQDQHDMLMLLNRARTVHPVPPNAADPFCPWTNFERSTRMAAWYGWREGNRLVALPMTGAPLHVDLPATSRLIRPALMSASTDLDVFLLPADGKELMLARFRHPDPKASAVAPKILWRHALDAPAVSAAATLSAETAGSERRLAIAAQSAATLLITVINAGDGASVRSARTVRVPDAWGMPTSRPALFVDPHGGVNVSIMIGKNPHHTELAVADIRIRDQAGEGPEELRVTPIGRLEKQPEAAATVYDVSPGHPPTRDWAVLLDNRELLHTAPGKRTKLAAAPAQPIELVRLGGVTYVLLLHAGGKPELAMLR